MALPEAGPCEGVILYSRGPETYSKNDVPFATTCDWPCHAETTSTSTETFAGIIVVGLAVDYVVHQAHMYEDAAHCEYHYQTREERFKHSATKMGSTVIAGAITTAGSGCFMFLCQLGFFYKMAVLIVITIMFSFIYSLLRSFIRSFIR